MPWDPARWAEANTPHCVAVRRTLGCGMLETWSVPRPTGHAVHLGVRVDGSEAVEIHQLRQRWVAQVAKSASKAAKVRKPPNFGAKTRLGKPNGPMHNATVGTPNRRQFKRLQTISQAPGGPRDLHHIGIHRHRCRPAGQILRTALEVMFAQHQPRGRANLLRMVHHQPHLLANIRTTRPPPLRSPKPAPFRRFRSLQEETDRFLPSPRSSFGFRAARQQHRKRAPVNQSTGRGHTLGMFDQHVDSKFHQVRPTRLGTSGLLEPAQHRLDRQLQWEPPPVSCPKIVR